MWLIPPAFRLTFFTAVLASFLLLWQIALTEVIEGRKAYSGSWLQKVTVYHGRQGWRSLRPAHNIALAAQSQRENRKYGLSVRLQSPPERWTSSSQTHLLNVCNLSKWNHQPGTECQSTWAYGGFSHSNHSPVIQSLRSCGSHSFAAEKNFHINRVLCWINYVCGIAFVY